MLAPFGRKINGPLEPVGKIWPSGKFGIGWNYAGNRQETPHECSKFAGRKIYIDEGHGGEYSNANLRARPLGLSNVPNYHSPDCDDGCPSGKLPRGSNGITRYGMNIVESACWLLEKKYGKRNLSFVTVTLPTVTPEESWSIAANWGNIVRVFFQRLRRIAKKKGMDFHYVAVTEFQPHRANREEHPALHLHFVVHGRFRNRFVFGPSDVRQSWAASLERFVSGALDWSACENLQSIKKSAASYLGKYMSKGLSDIERIRGFRPLAPLPSAWYSVSRALLRAVKGAVVTDSSVLAWVTGVGQGLNSSGFFAAWFEVNLDFGNGWGLKGLAGKLAPAILDQIHRSLGIDKYVNLELDTAC